MPLILDINDLCFSYARQPVLEGITLGVTEGLTLGVIGPNGGGKTTLVKLILGLLLPERGSIQIAGLSARDAVRRGDLVGYLPQQPTISTDIPLSTREFVRLGLAGKTGMFHSYSPVDLDFVEGLLHQLQIDTVATMPIAHLSGGQLQRALIAKALAPKPRLLVLDEPTVGVDRKGQNEFLQLLSRLKTELRLTIVMVSHDLGTLVGLADRIACIGRTIHFHDVPQRLPAELVTRLFDCNLAALGITDPCADPSCDGKHVNVVENP